MDMQEFSQMSERYQVSITLSEKCYSEFAAVASWKKIPLGTFIRQILEREHESPSFGNLAKRASSEENQ